MADAVEDAQTASSTSEIQLWDAEFTRQIKEVIGPFIGAWFRPEVRGLHRLPRTDPALIVSNHSGGMMTPDVLIFARAYYSHFGFDRPLHTLAHNFVFIGPAAGPLMRLGVIHANRANAAAALRSGSAVLVFPGGDYDSYRPTFAANTIDFNGRTGYITTALNAHAPIVPAVSIGAQQTQLFLTRGTWLAKRLGLARVRTEILPLSIGIPFGPSVFFPPNLPLPTKVVTEVLEPIDVVDQFGADPDVTEVDTHVRAVMQNALDRLAHERRFPIIG